MNIFSPNTKRDIEKSYRCRYCGVCGKPFIYENGHQKYCSEECRKTARREQYRRYYHENPEHFRKLARLRSHNYYNRKKARAT